MTRSLPVVLVAVLAALARPLAAQTPPDFSGTWTMDPARSQSAVQNEPVKSMTLVIRQSPGDLTIEYTRDGRVQTVTYKPGTPGTLTTVASAGQRAAIWYWDGPTLVTEALSNVNDTTVRHKATYSLDPASTDLTVESLVIVEHGYTLSGSKNYGSGKDVFRKVAR